MNDDRHAAYDHVSNCIARCKDLVHIVGMLKIAYGKSWKSRRMSWMRNSEEVRLNISKPRVQIYMRLIAGRKRSNMMSKHHLSLG